MKYLNVILTVIAVFLAAIAFRLYEVKLTIANQNESVERIVLSNQAVIESSQTLGAGLVELRKEIASIADKLTKK